MMNAFEHENRAKKVRLLVAAIWADAVLSEQHRDTDLPWRVSRAPEEWWKLTSTKAGATIPSPISRDLVVFELCLRSNSERRGAPVPCSGEDKPCDGGKIRWRICTHSGACPCAHGERDCRTCGGSGEQPCENCGWEERPGIVVTPRGHFCDACATEEFPTVARLARVARGQPEDPFIGLTEGDGARQSPAPSGLRASGRNLVLR